MIAEKHLTELQSKVFSAISKNDVGELKDLLAQLHGSVDYVDENGMTPLQHACYKGNADLVQILLDQGSNVNSSEHASNYTALHFAALSGKSEICRLLLLAGADHKALNSVNRTPAQMAAFVGNHAAVGCINNFLPLSQIETYTKVHGQQNEPMLPLVLLESFHKFIIQSNIHPVRIAMNLQRIGVLSENLEPIRKVLNHMSEKEMQNQNEIMALKYHYLSWIVNEIIKCREYFQSKTTDNKNDCLELFAKRVLKENKTGQLEYLESTIRDCVREFSHRDIAIIRQIVMQLASKEHTPALDVIRTAINGQRGFNDIVYCSTCGEEKPDKKCSKCKQVQYCDRECQRLHWFMHKKTCTRPTTTPATLSTSQEPGKNDVDSTEISQQLENLLSV